MLGNMLRVTYSRLAYVPHFSGRKTNSKTETWLEFFENRPEYMTVHFDRPKLLLHFWPTLEKSLFRAQFSIEIISRFSTTFHLVDVRSQR